jgi:hypothetical protein
LEPCLMISYPDCHPCESRDPEGVCLLRSGYTFLFSRKKKGSSVFRWLNDSWGPVFTGVTTLCETVNHIAPEVSAKQFDERAPPHASTRVDDKVDPVPASLDPPTGHLMTRLHLDHFRELLRTAFVRLGAARPEAAPRDLFARLGGFPLETGPRASDRWVGDGHCGDQGPGVRVVKGQQRAQDGRGLPFSQVAQPRLPRAIAVVLGPGRSSLDPLHRSGLAGANRPGGPPPCAP